MDLVPRAPEPHVLRDRHHYAARRASTARATSAERDVIFVDVLDHIQRTDDVELLPHTGI